MNDFNYFTYNDNNDTEEEDPGWPVPDAETMEKRILERQKILDATPHQRVIHNREGHGRNIVNLLYQRERFGIKNPRPLRRKRKIKKNGAESPSTVFESPISTTARLELHPEDSNEEHIPPPQYESVSSIESDLRKYAEWYAATKFHSAFLQHLGGNDPIDANGQRPASSVAVSTISVAFASDGKTLASTHGDHSVKITCCYTGRLLKRLDGHPRTPWTVKYHPTDTRIVASGCLGHQVRVWNWTSSTCLQMIRLDFAVISLSFHPTGKVLAIANGTRLHFWGVDTVEKPEEEAGKYLAEIDQRHNLRCVHFPPSGDTIIIGGANPTTEDPRRRRGAPHQLSFYLRIWDFDLSIVFKNPSEAGLDEMNTPRRSISNPRTFVPRALLYNDGGFDISPDGKKLCVCVEYWLPHGCDNVMDLYHSETQKYEEEQRLKEEEMRRKNREDQIPVDVTMSNVDEDADGTTSFPDTPDRSGPRELMEKRSSSLSIEPPPPPPPAFPDGFVPRTPENSRQEPRDHPLSPPSPPARPMYNHSHDDTRPPALVGARGYSSPPPPPPAANVPAAPGPIIRPPHPLSLVTNSHWSPNSGIMRRGRYVPHIAVLSLDTAPIPEEFDLKLPRGKSFGALAKGYQPRIGQLLEAHPLDENKASAVTCVKFSPSTDYCLIGYGVREQGTNSLMHPVTAIYKIDGGMKLVSTMLSGDDDVNIARFHPTSGHGFVYGTKQGRVRILAPRPWMFYNN